MPNSPACLIALIVSVPALARPTIWAPDACACKRYDEKSGEASGWFTLPTTSPPPSVTTRVSSSAIWWPKA